MRVSRLRNPSLLKHLLLVGLTLPVERKSFAMVDRTLVLLLQLMLLAKEDLPKYELTLISCIASLHLQR